MASFETMDFGLTKVVGWVSLSGMKGMVAMGTASGWRSRISSTVPKSSARIGQAATHWGRPPSERFSVIPVSQSLFN